ncbi:hypothetical protein [Solemya velesiana gill symbiont]|uniref:hypothetical protein n=1 Tax=Solemya velesiana gill symbiont TaxID=1918948 RepID=UPI001FE770D4|nr:hypothetical protein [Solemya velesiana gill symbiont]
MRAVLFDLDGVLYVGDRVIAGAVEVLEWVRRENIPHLFLTNTTSRPRSAIAEKLAAMGIVVGESEILTPPLAAAAWVRQHRLEPVALFIPDITRIEFSDIRVLSDDQQAGAASVVVGDLGGGLGLSYPQPCLQIAYGRASAQAHRPGHGAVLESA